MEHLQEKSISSELHYFKEEDLFDEDGDYSEIAKRIWVQYMKAMRKRRPDSELPFDRFVAYLLRNDVWYYQYHNSFVIGQVVHNNFIPTHFSPAGLKEGIDIIKQLRTFENIVFVVTKDLKDMLVKLGFTVMPLTVTKQFRDSTIEKYIVMSNWLFGLRNEIFNSLKDRTAEAYEFIKTHYKGAKGSVKKLLKAFKRTLTKDEYIDTEELQIDLDTLYNQDS